MQTYAPNLESLNIVCRGEITAIQSCPLQTTLYTLGDFTQDVYSSCLQTWSTETQQATSTAREFMEGWSLTCFCVTNQDSSGNEVIAAAVSGMLTAAHTSSCI